VTATGGTVNFSNLRVDVLGTGYTLGFSATGVTGVTSAGFAVTAGAAATIVIQTQPAGAVAGAAFTTQPVLRLHDSFGNLVTQNNTTVVTASLSANPGNDTLGGTVAVAASGGVVTFGNLKLEKASAG